MKMIFISNNWADAHQQTRLTALQKLSLKIVSLAVIRNYYPLNSQIKPVIIGIMEHVSYWKRGKVYIKLFYQLIKISKRNDFIYVFGFDLFLISLLFKVLSRQKIRVIYEVPDIREMFFSKSVMGDLIRWIEKRCIPKIDLLVVTSPEFVSKYYMELRQIAVPDYLIIENKVHSTDIIKPLFSSDRTVSINSKKIRIGYFGVLRCPVSLNFLISLAKKNQFEIILRGIFMPLTQHYQAIIEKSDHIYYLGPYKVSEDLYSIYSSIDVVWAIYPFSENKTGNHVLARTNRFYESLFFKKPFIVQKGSADAENSKILGDVAIEIDLRNPVKTEEEINFRLTRDNMILLQKALSQVPENNYQITSEYNDLNKCLQPNK